MDLVILGGTFDPIHFGHLRPAEEVRQALGFDRILLIPAGQPPHRHTPSATAAQRLEMARRAVAAHPHIEVSDMELVRSGPSYAVDTLRALRAQDPSGRLAYVIGMDAFLRFDTWHRWPEILDLVHLVVALRPGWPAAELPEVLRQTLRSRQSQRVEDILSLPCGRILFQTVTALDISATQIRGLIRHGRSPRFLLPDPVLDYIEQEGLYRNLEKATKEWTAPC